VPLGPPLRSTSNIGESDSCHLATRRKWSLVGSYEHEQPAPTEQEIKYLSLSLREFDEMKKEKFPDSIVEERSKMLQINIDQ
jgi:hypothetical protein